MLKQNLRDAFRIDDWLAFDYQIVPAHELENPNFDPYATGTGSALVNSLREINKKQHSLLGQLKKYDPDLINYLKLLDKKVELLTFALDNADEDFHNCPKQPINLSETGARFYTAEILPTGATLRMRLSFMTEHCTIQLYAIVARSSNDYTEQATTAVKFVSITPEDRDILAKHIINRQQHARMAIN